MIRRFILVCLFTTLAGAVARPALALPEIYAGAGVHRFGFGSSASATHSLALGAGVDDLFRGFGLGVNAYMPFTDFPSSDPVINLDLRYSIFKIPFLRVFAGVGAGTKRSTLKAYTNAPAGSTAGSTVTKTESWGGALEAFIGARVSLGLWFVGLDIGAAKWEDFQPYGILTAGLTF